MERVGDEVVLQVLCRDKGSQAHLTSWTSESLASKLDGSTSNFFNLRVKYEVSGQEEEACYAAKLSPAREPQADDFSSLIFSKECRFYNEVLPALSSVLEEINETPLAFPKCYYTSTEDTKEMLIFENLKEKGYLMQDKALGVDLAHATLVMRELGKLHAASIALQNKLDVNLIEKYDIYKTEWTEKFNWGCNWGEFLDRFLETARMMFEEMGGCEGVLAWIREVKGKAWAQYKQMIEKKSPFATITHGDCWINNMFFRYDEAGQPVGVTLFDLQGTRIASVALDLQHFLNLNVKGEIRRKHFDTLLATYYTSLSTTLTAGKVSVPFTLQELKAEYISKGLYGVLYSIMFLPCMVSKEETSYVFEETEKRRETVMRMVHTNGLLRPTLLSVIDEWTERGLISS